MSRKEAEERVRKAVHQRKPDAPNTTVIKDSEGHVIMEIYAPMDKPLNIKSPDDNPMAITEGPRVRKNL